MPRLRHRRADGAEEAFVVAERARIGRGGDCEIVLDDDGVSRRHAELVDDGGRWRIQDLKSRNGTFLNGERVEDATLRPGDVVRLGQSAELVFEDDDGNSAAEAGPGRRRRATWLSETRFALAPAGGGPAVPLGRELTVVGRDAGAHLVLEDDSVSRMHARLDRRLGTLVVTDLKSRNGTRVNGAPVLRGELGAGDRVQFGEVEFEVIARPALAWRRLAVSAGTLAAIAAAVFGIAALGDWLGERAAIRDTEKRLRAQALFSAQKGIEAHRRQDRDYARSYLLYAGELLLLSDLAPRGSSLARPQELFRGIARELPPADRDFDFAKALDPEAAATTRVRLEQLSDREYVEREVRRIAIELGQDENVPDGFADQVWAYVQENVRYPGKFQTMLARSVPLQPRLRSILAEAHLPEVFCYVAWTESDLDPNARSRAGARGLWQFVESTGRNYGLRVEPGRGIDERTDVVKSTRAATRYIGNLIKTFGREQFMCALASYNRGESGVRRAMERIPDPMMQSSRKYWYLVEHRLLPAETAAYVSRIFTACILAGNPERFGFRR